MSIGIDLIEVSRFNRFEKQPNHSFLKKVFFDSEISYCFTYKEPASHLAGIFAAKEAVSKALGVAKYPFSSLEIRHRADGAPEAWRGGKKLRVQVSITHTAKTAAAVAVQ